MDLWREEQPGPAAGELVERVELPEGRHPALRMSLDAAGGVDGEPVVRWRVRWSTTPVAVWLRGCGSPFVLLPLALADSPNGERRRKANFAVVRRQDLGALAGRLSGFLASCNGTKQIYVTNGPDLSFTPCANWNHLVLNDTVARLVRDDFTRFFSHRAWFASKGIPFRRGYLLYGPPGNGKTSVVRAMASMPGLSPCTLVWGRPTTDDDDLTMLFRWAADHAPSLVIMEDLDRHFANGPHQRRHHAISLAHLLNCLDGIQNTEGVIVVATANNPKDLDPAILNRPGRFDRVVEFPSPDEALRAEFFRKQLNNGCAEEGLRRMVRRSAGFSFAQLRECYVTAAYLAFEKNREVTEADLAEAVELFASAARRPGAGNARKPVGFSEAGEAA